MLGATVHGLHEAAPDRAVLRGWIDRDRPDADDRPAAIEEIAADDAALALDPAFAPAQLNLAVLLDLFLGEPVEAMAHYQRYLALAPVPDERAALWAREASSRTGIALETESPAGTEPPPEEEIP